MFREVANRSLRFGTSLGAALLGLAGAPAPLLVAPAMAQGACSDCDIPPHCREETDADSPFAHLAQQNCQKLEITIESDMDFGRVVLLGEGEGRVMLDPITGKKTLIGSVDDLGGMPFAGRAVITGAPFQAVLVNLPNEVSMRDVNGGNARIRDFVTDLEGFPTLDSNGRLEFSFSATLVLGQNQEAAGRLRG
ncbi:MAG: DUF4402 domain-containing protein, partial [Pseudomonadota bacterium]